ncbi:MAG: hypothetical protein L6R41_005821 [Letrouitia leprolyta]|nr:MAG: hypothetical protein L6R41_005821 [Letrouitia leprolyta]
MLMPTGSISCFIAILPLLTSAAPALNARQDGPGHSYECEAKYNAAAKKQQLRNDGATARDLAIAIMETGCAMSGTAYPLGDLMPNGQPKTDDSANFGLFKNNFLPEQTILTQILTIGGNIRQYCDGFKGKAQSDWQQGQSLNTDDAAAIKCQHAQMDAQGNDWYETQRGRGYGGQEYHKAIDFVTDFLNQGHLTDNTVTYYNLHGV